MTAAIYRFLRSSWRLLPKELREMEPVRRVTQPIAETFREHKQGLYHDSYFANDVEPAAARASRVIVESIVRDFRPATVLDLGCGTGALLAEFATRGVKVTGLEYSDAGIERATRRGIDVRRFDVRYDGVSHLGRFDVVCCTEVAEHVPARFADRLVESLAALGPTVVFTAATPGQGGVDHVNEQPHSYWIAKFRARGLELNRDTSAAWQTDWHGAGIQDWYWKNVMVFESAE